MDAEGVTGAEAAVTAAAVMAAEAVIMAVVVTVAMAAMAVAAASVLGSAVAVAAAVEPEAIGAGLMAYARGARTTTATSLKLRRRCLTEPNA
jgi:hypothetical protein